MMQIYTVSEAVEAGIIDNFHRSDWIVGAPSTARIIHEKKKHHESVRYVACGNPECRVSTGIDGSTTHGSGELSDNGFWEYPCQVCSDDYKRRYPEG
jgi:hypothetical protein